MERPNVTNILSSFLSSSHRIGQLFIGLGHAKNQPDIKPASIYIWQSNTSSLLGLLLSNRPSVNGLWLPECCLLKLTIASEVASHWTISLLLFLVPSCISFPSGHFPMKSICWKVGASLRLLFLGLSLVSWWDFSLNQTQAGTSIQIAILLLPRT